MRDTEDYIEFELRFQSLFDPGRRLAFPCDAAGNVDLDRLGHRALNNYLFARATVGREFSHPKVVDGCAASRRSTLKTRPVPQRTNVSTNVEPSPTFS